MGQTNVKNLGNGGTMDGDVTITGDLTVSGGIGLSLSEVIEGTSTIDVTSTEALLVRKNGDGGDIFIVDTNSPLIKMGGNLTFTHSGATISSTLGFLQLRTLETGKNMLIDCGDKFKFRDMDSGNAVRVAIDSANGNLSIGTDTATNNLHIEATAGDGGITIHSAGNTGNAVILDANRSGTDSGIGTMVGKWDGTTIGYMGFFSGNDTGSKGGVLKFATAPNGGSSTVALTMDSSQNVGIGMTPASRLSIKANGDTSTVLDIHGRSSDDFAIISFKENASQTVKGQIKVDGSDSMIFRTGASTDALTITSGNAATFAGDVTVSSSSSNKPVLTLENSNNDDSPAFLVFKKSNSGSAADGDEIGQFQYKAFNDAGTPELTTYADNYISAEDVSNGSEDGSMTFRTMKAGTLTQTMQLKSGDVTFSGNNYLSNDNAIWMRNNAGNADTSAIFTNTSDELVLRTGGSTDSLKINTSGNATFGGGLVTMNRSAADESLSLAMYSTVDGHMPALLFKKSASNTIGTASATGSGDVLGQIVFQGHDTDNDVKAGAIIRASADAAPDGDSVPTKLQFMTSDLDDSGSPTVAMTIDDGQNVGIGTVTPTHKLEVTVSDSGDPAVDIYNTHATNGYGLRVSAGDDDNVYALRVGDKDGTELMTIGGGGLATFAGEVSIGTGKSLSFSPSVYTSAVQGIKFDQAGGTADAIIQPVRVGDVGVLLYLGSNTFVNTSGGNDRYNNSEESAGIEVRHDGQIRFLTGGTGADPTEKMSIDSSGNSTFSGIVNVTGAGLKITGQNLAHVASSLTIAQESSSLSELRFYGADSSTAGSLRFMSSQSDGSGGGTVMKLDANSRISLSNNDSGTGGSDSTSGTTLLGWKAGIGLTSGSKNNSFFGHASGFNNSSGDHNVGLGTYAGLGNRTGDNNTFVGSNAGLSDNVSSHSNNTAIGFESLKAVTTGGSNIAVGGYSADTITDGNENTCIGYAARTDDASATNQTVIGRATTGVADNSVTLGNASVTDVYMAQDSGALVHTAGIQFPATFAGNAGANVLDEYEEGTWTPVVKDAQSTPNAAGMVSGATGFYTRIGNIVNVSFACQINSVSGMTSTDNITIHGLPFTVDNNSVGGGEPHGGIITFIHNLDSADYGGLIMARANNNTTHIELKYTAAGAGTAVMNNGLLVSMFGASADTYMCGSVTYKIN